MEKIINQLQTTVDEIKKRPSTHIDRIEYKFDQLKVETLDGTLNIGLNPTNGEQIEEFAVSQQGKTNIPDVRHIHKPVIEKIENEINEFLTNDCYHIISQLEKSEGYILAEGYSDFIIEDIRNQIHERIHYYLQQYQADLRTPVHEKEIYQSIITKVKMDIQNSITSFMNHIPDNMKEGKPK
nr:spore germination protein GerPC [Fredinandcohnia sp. SECRCQ15]